MTKVQLARGTSVSAAKFSGNSKLANRTVRFKSAADGGKSNNNNNSSGTKAKSILRNAGTTKRVTRSQTKNQEKSEEEDNVEMMGPVKVGCQLPFKINNIKFSKNIFTKFRGKWEKERKNFNDKKTITLFLNLKYL